MSFGERLRSLREEKQMSREQLASRLEMSYSAIAKYETNERFPDKETLVKIAQTLDVSTDFLLGKEKSRDLPDTVAPYLPEGFDELTPDAKKEVLDFIDYIMVKYARKEDKKKD